MADVTIKINWLALVLSAATILANAGCALDDESSPDPMGAQYCPAWVYFPSEHHSNKDSTYLGCSNHSNLVNMLESPADLDQGRPLGPAGGEREAAVLKDYDLNKAASFKDNNAPNIMPVPPGSPAGAGQ